jgi:hypothetical protein
MNNTKYLCLGLVIAGLIGLSTTGIFGTGMKVAAQEMNMTGMAGGDNMTGMAGMEEGAGMEHMGSMPTYVVRDSVALNLDGATLPAGGFIHLYDTTPYMIMNGHVAVNVPCAENSTASINVLLGQAPNLTAAELENLPELSTPGTLCLYHVDVVPGEAPGTEMGHEVITDVAIQNAGEEDIEFPAGSTAVVGINEIMPGAEEHHGAEEAEEPAA